MSSLRRTLLFAILVCAGCAQLIGGQFDDATLASDASTDDAGVQSDVAAPREASDDGPSSEMDASIDVLALGDLQLWLAADEGITRADADAATAPDAGDAGDVLEWNDLSGHGHGGYQPTSANRPSLIPNALAGKPVVTFARASQTCLTTTWTGAPGGVAATIFAVVGGAPDSLLRFQGTLPGALIFPYNVAPASTPDYRFLVASSTTVEVRMEHDPSAYDLIAARVEPNVIGGVRTWRNGALVEQSSLFVDAMPAADAFAIGCSSAGKEFADASVAEILYYNAALSDESRAFVESYLREKWKLVF